MIATVFVLYIYFNHSKTENDGRYSFNPGKVGQYR